MNLMYFKKKLNSKKVFNSFKIKNNIKEFTRLLLILLILWNF